MKTSRLSQIAAATGLSLAAVFAYVMSTVDAPGSYEECVQELCLVAQIEQSKLGEAKLYEESMRTMSTPWGVADYECAKLCLEEFRP